MVDFKWDNNRWKYKKISDAPGDLYLKDPDTRELISIKRLEPLEAEETLGVFLASNGNNKIQIKKLRQKSSVFSQLMKDGSISRYDANYALRSTIIKTWYKQNIQQIQYVIGEMNNNSIATNLILTSFKQWILEAGLGLLIDTWWWRFLSSNASQRNFVSSMNAEWPSKLTLWVK